MRVIRPTVTIVSFVPQASVQLEVLFCDCVDIYSDKHNSITIDIVEIYGRL